jgi:hypothetical protein
MFNTSNFSFVLIDGMQNVATLGSRTYDVVALCYLILVKKSKWDFKTCDVTLHNWLSLAPPLFVEP